MNAANEAIEERRTGRVVTVSEWCRISGYSVSAVEGMIAEGLPLTVTGGPGRPHKFDSARAIVWLLRRERERTRRETLAECGYEETEADGERRAARASTLNDRLQLAKVKREEIELAKLDGSVVEMETVETILTNLVATARARMLALPARLAPQCAVLNDAADVRKLLEDGVHEALEEMAATGPEVFVGEVKE